MLIEKCILNNFRQFFGKNSIEFSTNPKNNITLIRGGNASGKTNLINAICWCLYGRESMTPKWGRDLRPAIISWHLSNATNRKTAKALVSVESIVNCDGKRYSIRRHATFKEGKGHAVPAPEKASEKLFITRLFRNGRKQLLPIQSVTNLLSQTTDMGATLEWYETFRFGIHRDKDAIRTVMSEMLGEDYDKKVPRVVLECEKIFKVIMGVEYSHLSSRLIMRDDYQLEIVSESHGQNFVHSLAAGPSEALSLAFLLAVIKVSGRQFPLMLDSPFSRISPFKRNLIIKELGKLRLQVIIVAHDGEMNGGTTLSIKMGKEYDIRLDPKNWSSKIVTKAIVNHESHPVTNKQWDVIKR